MWIQPVVTLVIGLLSVAVGANWLIGGATRRLRSIKAHAELLALLDKDSRGKRELTAYLDRVIGEHLEALAYKDVMAWVRIAQTLAATAIVAGTANLVVTVWSIFADDIFAEWLYWTLIALPIVLVVPFVLVARRIGFLLGQKRPKQVPVSGN